ncbi:MAG: DUF4199 domain-containing protein [Bacteroidetes bacterium]|nr:DUF4199 domain-containing protein [Bacteroidota bacterium]
MEEKKPSAGTSALIYGLLLAVALIIVHLILYIADFHQSTGGFVVSMLVLAAGIVLASLDYRNKKLGGYISYGKAVKIGFLTVLFASFIVAAYTFVYHNNINSAEIQQAKIEAAQKIYEMDMDQAKEEQYLKWADYMNTPVVYAVGAIFMYSLIGIVMALITSIFIKNEEQISLG